MNAREINSSIKKVENSYNNFKIFEFPNENNNLISDIHSKILNEPENASINNIKCNFSYTECEYGKVKVIINDIENLRTRKTYLEKIALTGNYLAPKIYSVIHDSKNIETENLLSEIKIEHDSSSNLAYAKPKFKNLLDSEYNQETGVYLGNIDFTYTDISGVLIHELTHYLKVPEKSDNFNDFHWIEEGISDYVVDKLGYSDKISNRYPHCVTSENYQNGYMCAADFFIFIENKYQKNIPRQYVYMLENGIGIESYDTFVTKLFKEFVGKDLGTLWNEYLKEKNN